MTAEQLETDIRELERIRDRLSEESTDPAEHAARVYLQRLIDRRRQMLADLPSWARPGASSCQTPG